MITFIVIVVILLIIFDDGKSSKKKNKKKTKQRNLVNDYDLFQDISGINQKREKEGSIPATKKVIIKKIDKDTSIVSNLQEDKRPKPNNKQDTNILVNSTKKVAINKTNIFSDRHKVKCSTRAINAKNLSDSLTNNAPSLRPYGEVADQEERIIICAQQTAPRSAFSVNDWSDGIPVSCFFTKEHWQQLDYPARNDISNHALNELIYFLEQHQIRYFYHFTDLTNLPAILQAGTITPGNELKANQVSWASDDISHKLDRRDSLDLGNYVHLSFCKYHPMLFAAKKEKRIATPVVLELDISLLGAYPFLFTDCNAVSNISQKGCDKSFLEKNINFGIFRRSYFDLDYVGRGKYQAEIMIKSCINVRFINKIYAVSTIYDPSYQQNIFDFSSSYQRI